MKIDTAIEILKDGKWWGYLAESMPYEIKDELCDAVTVVTAAHQPAHEGQWQERI